MDQQGNDDSPAVGEILDATVIELPMAAEPSIPNPSIYRTNPWMQYLQNPTQWNPLSLFLQQAFLQQAGYQLPPTAHQAAPPPYIWPGAPLPTGDSSLQTPSYPLPAFQNLGMFHGIPLLAPIESPMNPGAGAAGFPAAGFPVTDYQTTAAVAPPTAPTLATPTKLPPPQRTSRKKRARILREGQLTMIVYGANEALTWARRVAQFQNVMRNVLGDRRKTFTWSGSVTDSVVGAFLTQNVSDALSSRAYMELASRWSSTFSGTLDDVADTVDWEAVRTADVNEIADAIRCRGMQTILSTNIQAFLNHLRRYNLLKNMVRVAASGGFRGIETDILATVDTIMDTIVENVEQAEKIESEEVDLVMENLVESVAELKNNDDDILEIGEESIVENRGSLPTRRRHSSSSPSRIHISLAYEEEEREKEIVNSTSNVTPLSAVESSHHLEKKEIAARLLSSEWLREVPDDEAREFLMSINGLGRKSVACIMLLTLGKKEFPVDTNVGRICSRLGWIPLDAAEAIEELDDYAPEPEVHAYLRSRLLGFDIETLYELHYQMITLGKVFCSKHSPNCTACPMQKECEYALHNGPSLHGRKRMKTANTDQEGGINGGGLTAGMATAAAAAGNGQDSTMMPNSPEPRPSVLLRNSTDNSKPTVHWRTQQKLNRLAEEKAARDFALAEHSRLYSTLDLEDLVNSRKTRHRSAQPHRHPRDIASIGGTINPVSRLQRAETEINFLAEIARWQKVYPINWIRLDTMDLAARGLLPDSVWDTTVAMDIDMDHQRAQLKHVDGALPEEQNGGPDASAASPAAAADTDFCVDEAVDGISSLNTRLAAWENALNEAPPSLQYPSRGGLHTAANKFTNISSPSTAAVGQGTDHLCIWDLADKPPPPPLPLQSSNSPPAPPQQQQEDILPAGPPPLVLKSKPVIDPSDKANDKDDPLPSGVGIITTGEDQAAAGAGADVNAPPVAVAAVGVSVDVIDLNSNGAIDFIPPEGMTELDITENELAELLPEMMSWLPPPEQIFGAGAGAGGVDASAATVQLPLHPQNAAEITAAQTVLPPSPVPVSPLLSSPSLNIELECQRLQQLAVELAAENEETLKLEQGADASIHRKRLLQISLQALNFDLSLSVDSAESVVTAARSNYRQLAKALHPDKCKLPGAADAFSGLAMAMRIVSEYSSTQQEHEQQQEIKNKKKSSAAEQQKNTHLNVAEGAVHGDTASTQQNNQSPPDFDSAPTTGSLSTDAPTEAASLDHRIVWNASRLVVAAHILPAHVHRTFSHLHSASLTTSTIDEEQQVMFLPMENIPTFQREELAGRRKTRARATENGNKDNKDDVQVILDDLMNAVCQEDETEVLIDASAANGTDDGCIINEAEEGEDMVEGMLLVTCRAALRGRFPLNGTYFQINELFADHHTAVEAVKIPQSVLDTTKTCAIYFGLGIHYMSKAMSQEEVAFMFTDGWVCFRAFDPETRAPMLLPHFLMPSVPTTTTSTWKNKTERGAIKAAKLAAKTGNGVVGSMLDIQFSRPQQQWNTASLQGGDTMVPKNGLNDPLSAPKRKKKNHAIVDSRFDMTFSPPSSSFVNRAPRQPMSQEALDAKSGKGKSRRRTFGPIIKSSQKCGLCKPCLNPGWKKPCDVRRAEMLAKMQEEQNHRHEQEQLQQQQQQLQQVQQGQEEEGARMIPPPAPAAVSPVNPVTALEPALFQ